MASFLDLPVSTHYFEVIIDNTIMRFQEVTGLEVSMDVQEINEGGRINNSLRYPSKTKYGTMSFKRGVIPKFSTLVGWVQEVSRNRTAGKVKPKDIVVTLMDENDGAVYSWSVKRAYPTKFAVSNLNSMESALAFETIEFTYQDFEIKL